jgi:outer membrane protein assembly factor BamB
LNIGNEVFAVSQFGIYSFNKHNGKIIWKKRVSESKLISNSKALFKKDIFITANSLFNDKDDFEIVKLEKNKKRVIWRYSLGKSEASFISINKENLYLIINQSNTERKLICVDVNDGRKKWEIIGNIKHGSEIICFGDFIYCSSDKGILKIDSKTGLIQEEISLKINFYKFYDVTNDYLLLRKQSNLFFLNLKERKITKTFDLKYYNLHKNGKLLFYSQKNSVFKIVNIFDSDLNALE